MLFGIVWARGCTYLWSRRSWSECREWPLSEIPEMNGARAGCCCRSRYMARGPSSVAVAAQWGRWKPPRNMARGPSSVAVAAQWGRWKPPRYMARGPSRCRSRYMARGPGFAAGAVQGARRRRRWPQGRQWKRPQGRRWKRPLGRQWR